MAISLVTFLASLALLVMFDRGLTGEQFALDVPWIASPDIHFYISMDGVSLWLVLLSTFLTPLAVLISWKHIDTRPKMYYALLLLLEFGLRAGGEAGARLARKAGIPTSPDTLLRLVRALGRGPVPTPRPPGAPSRR